MIPDGRTDGRIDSGSLAVAEKSADRMPAFTYSAGVLRLTDTGTSTEKKGKQGVRSRAGERVENLEKGVAGKWEVGREVKSEGGVEKARKRTREVALQPQ